MDYKNAVALGGPGLGKCLSDPDIAPCLPPSLRATPSSAPCNLSKALTATGPCFSKNFSCNPHWDGSTAGLNRMALMTELSHPTSCSLINTAVGVLKHPSTDLDLGNISDLAKWLKNDLLPCVTGGCYLSGGGNVANNPYTNLIPENIVQIQNKIEKLENLEANTVRKFKINASLAVMAALVVGVLLGMYFQKQK